MLRTSPAVLSLLLARSQTAAAGENASGGLAAAAQCLMHGSNAPHPPAGINGVAHVWPCFPPSTPFQGQTRGIARPARSLPKDRYTGQPTNYVQLLQHIGKTRKLYKLQELVSVYGDKFDAVHASAALVRLPKVAYRHGSASADDLSEETKKKVVALLQKLSGHMVGMRDRMYARQVANALWACGKLAQLSPGASFASSQLAREMLKELRCKQRNLLRSAAPREVAQILVGMAHLQQQEPKLMERLGAAVRQLLPHMTGGELAQVAWALAELRHEDTELMGVLADRAVEIKWHFQVKEAAMVAWAMAKQGVTHPGLMPALAEVAQEHGKHLKPASISMLAYALGKQGVRDEALLALLCQQALQHLGAFTDHGLGIMLRALRTLDYRHEELLRAVAGGIAEEEAVKVKAQEAGSLLEVFSHFGLKGRDVDGAAANLAESVARKLHKLRPPVVVSFLESLLASGRRDEQLMEIVADFVASQVDHYAKRMQYKSLQPRELSYHEDNPYDWDLRQQLALLQALNKLGYSHQGLLGAVSTSLMPTSWAASPGTLAYLVYELSKAGVRSTTLAAQIGENRLNPAIGGLSMRQMCAGLAGCAAMGSDNGPLARAVRDRLKEQPEQLTMFCLAVLPGAMAAEPKWFDPQAFDVVFERALVVVDQMDESGAAGLVAAMGKAGKQPAELVARIKDMAAAMGWSQVAADVAKL